MTEHAVIVHLPLQDGEFGGTAERQAVYALQEQLTAAIAAADAGEFDGNEFGDDEVVLYAYGPNAARLFAAMQPALKGFASGSAYATLRFGEASDLSAVEQRVDL